MKLSQLDCNSASYTMRFCLFSAISLLGLQETQASFRPYMQTLRAFMLFLSWESKSLWSFFSFTTSSSDIRSHQPTSLYFSAFRKCLNYIIYTVTQLFASMKWLTRSIQCRYFVYLLPDHTGSSLF